MLPVFVRWKTAELSGQVTYVRWKTGVTCVCKVEDRRAVDRDTSLCTAALWSCNTVLRCEARPDRCRLVRCTWGHTVVVGS